jgi:hypothetical protein
MQVELTCHPDHPTEAVTAVTVDIERSASGLLTLWYTVSGRIDALVVPPPAPEGRADRLWATTCFEAFLRHGDAPEYLELNFSPSSAWAAYAFSGYRQGMAPAELDAPPIVSTAYPFELLEVHVTASVPTSDRYRIGLSAVIEETNGNTSYWALAHPPGAPDFHHDTCFALELPSAE